MVRENFSFHLKNRRSMRFHSACDYRDYPDEPERARSRKTLKTTSGHATTIHEHVRTPNMPSLRKAWGLVGSKQSTNCFMKITIHFVVYRVFFRKAELWSSTSKVQLRFRQRVTSWHVCLLTPGAGWTDFAKFIYLEIGAVFIVRL